MGGQLVDAQLAGQQGVVRCDHLAHVREAVHQVGVVGDGIAGGAVDEDEVHRFAPPVASIVVPVMNEACGEARNPIASAISSGSPTLLTAWREAA